MMGEGDEGALFPRIPAVLRRSRGRRLEAVDLSAGWAWSASGRLADAVERSAVSGKESELLRALEDHPAARVSDWSKGPRLELTPANALRLGGFATLFLELLGTCNERCLHCYALSSPRQAEALDRATCEAVVDDAAALGFRRLQFTGGDPLLCGFLPALIARARERGIKTCEVYTNGLLLDDRLLDELQPFTPSFAFSFYSHVPHTHDAITRTPGSWERTRGAIRRAVSRGLRARASIIVMEENAPHVTETVSHLRSLGVEHVSASPTFAVGRGRRFDWRGDVPGASSSHAGPEADARPAGQGKLCVTYQGAVVPCIFNRRDVLGRVPEQRLTEIARAPKRPEGSADEAFLRRCRDELQCASCRLTACALRMTGGGEEPCGSA